MDENDRLDSWKEIAGYVRREIRTCYKWHKELNFPVYHINKKSSRSRVFAFKSEIDQWFKERAEEQKHHRNLVLGMASNPSQFSSIPTH